MGRKISAILNAVRRSFSDPQKRSSWQGRTGILVFLLFIISSLAVNQVVQALNLSSGSYGYYGGSYGWNASTTSSDYLPSAPTSLSVANIGNTVATASWTAPTTTTGSTSLDNLSSYTYATSTSSAPSTCSGGTNTNSLSTSLGLTSLSSSTTYYLAVCTTDSNGNNSAVVTTSFRTGSGSSGGGGGGGGASSDSEATEIGAAEEAATPVEVEAGESETVTFTVGVPASVSVGDATHTVTVSAATETEATITVESDPVTITVQAGESEDIDTDGDGINDLRVAYDGFDASGDPQLTITALEVVLACEMPSGSGVSPVTGDAEDITAVEAGDFIKSPGYSTVYYITADCGRRVFMNSQSYFTWQDSFDTLVDVTDATLSELSLEGIMLPKAGTTMVKVQSDPKVYWLADGDDTYTPDLRWVSSEDVADDMIGTNWADYIIDVEATFFSQFGSGDDITDGDSVDMDSGALKTRAELSI